MNKPRSTPEEQWKPCVGWENFYSISSLGNVYSHERQMVRSNRFPYTMRGKYLKPRRHPNGALSVIFSDHGEPTTRYISVLMRQARFAYSPTGLDVRQ